MTPSTIVVRGVVTPNGTLELEGKPQLPVGPVEVVVRALAVSSLEGRDWWQYLQAARKQLETMDYPFMNDKDVTAWVEDLRADDDRIEQAYGQTVGSARDQERP